MAKDVLIAQLYQRLNLTNSFASQTAFDPRFAVGEPVPKGRQVGREARVRPDQTMSVTIGRVAVRARGAAPKALISIHHRRYAVICQDGIESVEGADYRMVVRAAHLVESRVASAS